MRNKKQRRVSSNSHEILFTDEGLKRGVNHFWSPDRSLEAKIHLNNRIVAFSADSLYIYPKGGGIDSANFQSVNYMFLDYQEGFNIRNSKITK